MSAIREECKGCGMCCRAILLTSVTHDEIFKSFQYSTTEEGTDVHFVKHNFEALTAEQVKQINPYFFEEVRKVYEKEDNLSTFERILNNNFYRCTKLDEETGLCTIHESRPRMCSEYPWYNKTPRQDELFYTADCYYRRDLEYVENAN